MSAFIALMTLHGFFVLNLVSKKCDSGNIEVSMSVFRADILDRLSRMLVLFFELIN